MKVKKKSSSYVNLGKVQGIPHLELFEEVSKAIAEDNLQTVNEKLKDVKPRRSIYTCLIKRIIDIVVSLIILILTLPINLLIAFCTLIDVGKPLLFRQERVGLNGRPFEIVKFRNMTNKKDETGALLPPDQRVTKFGAFVRRTSLDELLNFWSILKGDMSLIGPRPLPFDYNDFYNVRHKYRSAVRPGLECPLITKKQDSVTWSDQFENDVYYVEHVSFGLDIKMVWLLVKMVFNKKNSSMRGNAVRGSFMGYNKDGSSINSQKVERKYFEKALHSMGFSDEEIGKL